MADSSLPNWDHRVRWHNFGHNLAESKIPNAEKPLLYKGSSYNYAIPRLGLGCSSGFRELDSWGVGPQPLEVIELSCLSIEQVDDEIPVIEQDPSAIVSALPAKWAVAEFTESELDVVGEASHMSVGGSGSDHEHIGDDHEI